MPITPKGTAFLVSLRPFGSSLLSRVLPSGVGSDATFLISEAMSKIRCFVSKSLSYNGLLLSIADRSFSFSTSNASHCASALSANASKTLFISSEESKFSFLEASSEFSFQLFIFIKIYSFANIAFFSYLCNQKNFNKPKL